MALADPAAGGLAHGGEGFGEDGVEGVSAGEAFPELVAEDAEGKLSVAYGNFAAVLLEAVKEQQATIEAQRKDLESMAKRLEALEARLGTAAGR